MRARLARVLRGLANRLMPQPCIHQVSVSTTRGRMVENGAPERSITVYLDGKTVLSTRR